MKKDLKMKLTAALVFLALFVFYTAAIRFVDVEKAGPEGSEIGFAGLNTVFSNKIGYRPAFWEAAQILGYLAILLCASFGAVGLYQLIKRRSFLKVDAQILTLGVFYLTVIFCYVLFEIIEVNYSPVLIDGKLKASYPSSHTMLGICVFGSAIPTACSYLKKSATLRRILCAILALLAALTVLTRFLSGVHWLTDIVGSILLSSALLEIYFVLLTLIKRIQYAITTEKKQ